MQSSGPETLTRALPDFVIIGAAKSATSLLAGMLRRHPRIHFCPNKEPQFFAYEELYSQGAEAYRRLFAGAREDQLCGEGTTDYTRYPQVQGVPARLRAANPAVKLIYVMRHPVDRAYSHFVHRYTRELHPGKPFRGGLLEHAAQDPMCLDSSLYALQLEQYLQHFELDAILPLASQDLREALPTTMSRVHAFLGIDDVELDWSRQTAEDRNDRDTHLQDMLLDEASAPLRNLSYLRGIARAVLPPQLRTRLYRLMLHTPRGKRLLREFTPPPLAPEERQWLIEFFEPHNRRLERMIGREFPDWRN